MAALLRQERITSDMFHLSHTHIHTQNTNKKNHSVAASFNFHCMDNQLQWKDAPHDMYFL